MERLGFGSLKPWQDRRSWYAKQGCWMGRTSTSTRYLRRRRSRWGQRLRAWNGSGSRHCVSVAIKACITCRRGRLLDTAIAYHQRKHREPGLAQKSRLSRGWLPRTLWFDWWYLAQRHFTRTEKQVGRRCGPANQKLSVSGKSSMCGGVSRNLITTLNCLLGKG